MNRINSIWRRIKSVWNRRIRKSSLSVIVPVYNGEDTIDRCLNSLLGQTRKRVKIICVNDGSTDKTAQILAKYQLSNRRIEIINQKNGGRSAARNAGLRAVKTKYVMFCDADDYYDLTMCKRMVDTINDGDADVAICGVMVHYDAHNEVMKSDKEYYRVKYEGNVEVNEDVILRTDVSVCNKIFRMNLIRKHKIAFPNGLNNEDFYFWNAYVSLCRRAHYIKDKLYNYVRHEGSIMSNNFEAKELSIDHLLVANDLFNFYKKNGFLREHLNLFWRQWIASFWFSYEHSANKYHWKIKEVAADFLEKQYEKNVPSDTELQQWKNDIDDTLKKIKGGKNERI